LFAQSASDLQVHVLVPPAHWPAVHTSPFVHELPSSQALPPLVASSTQTPDLGRHVFLPHAVSSAVAQVTTVAGFTAHVGGCLAMSQ
jgi:hypothetical protein